MSNDPINLDGRRTAAGRLETELRRRSSNGVSGPSNSLQPHLADLENQMLAEPARTWIDVMEKWRFLLNRYAATPDAESERIQELIKRAIGDMERLRKREEKKRP